MIINEETPAPHLEAGAFSQPNVGGDFGGNNNRLGASLADPQGDISDEDQWKMINAFFEQNGVVNQQI